MRVAAIYDIHGNLPALEAVLQEVAEASVDCVVVGGDVLPGPMPGESLRTVLELEIPVHFLRGNGEREVLATQAGGETDAVPERFREVMRWVGTQLTPELVSELEGWPDTVVLDVPPFGQVLFCHATPRSDAEIFTRLTPEDRLLPMFESVEAPFVVCGHTHMQFDMTVGPVRVVNAGSVGMPFGEPGAHWLLLGPDVDLRRTPYDLRTAADRIRTTNYPQAQAFADDNVLKPPSEDRMLKAFG